MPFIEKRGEETPNFSRGRKRRRGTYEFKCELEKRRIVSDRGNAVVGRACANRPNVARNDEVESLARIAVASLRL